LRFCFVAAGCSFPTNGDPADATLGSTLIVAINGAVYAALMRNFLRDLLTSTAFIPDPLKETVSNVTGVRF